MNIRDIKVGDVVRRMLAGVIPIDLKVTEVDEEHIHCGPWKFLKTTGGEVDEDLFWDGINRTGSQLVGIVVNKTGTKENEVS